MTNYRRGYEQERRVKTLLEAKGFYVQRAGASKGPVDLIAIPTVETYNSFLGGNHQLSNTLVLQVKSTHDKSFNPNRPSFLKTVEDFIEMTNDFMTDEVKGVLVYVHIYQRKVRVHFYVWDNINGVFEEVAL